jgi:cell division protein FtsW
MRSLINKIFVDFEVVDRMTLWTILFLLGFGLIQVYSSSYILGTDLRADGLFFVKKQLLFTILGLGVILITLILKTKALISLCYYAYYFVLAGLALTLIPGIGVHVGGASRWLSLPFGLRLEPSEFIKVLILFPFSYWLLQIRTDKFFSEGVLTRLGLMLLPFILFLLQPDFGSFVLLSWVILILLFTFFRPLWPVLVASASMAGLASFLLYIEPYRLKRLQSFLDPWADPKGSGFQIIQSLLSFRSGGFFGRGIGEGQGKLYFLPEAHTDFTMAVLGEEWGFIGFLAFMLLIGTLIVRGLQNALAQHDEQRRIIAFGLITLFSYSVFLNVCVVLGLLPTKGLSLPFMSYGGSSLISTCLLFGILLNLSCKKN